MNAYSALANWYDGLTGDVPYESFADFYESLFRKNGGEFTMLLDLCCGTGTLTRLMAERGYEMIASDASEEMLMQAREKSEGLSVPPLFLCQDASELDLYGTVDAAYCSLDGMNYLPSEDLPEVFRRLHLFVRPGGLLIFDIRSAESFAELDGQVFVDENEEVLCLWRSDFEEETQTMYYEMDLFSQQGSLWRRDHEEHIEYAHKVKELFELLEKSGFKYAECISDGPQAAEGRLFITSIRSEEYNG